MEGPLLPQQHATRLVQVQTAGLRRRYHVKSPVLLCEWLLAWRVRPRHERGLLLGVQLVQRGLCRALHQKTSQSNPLRVLRHVFLVYGILVLWGQRLYLRGVFRQVLPRLEPDERPLDLVERNPLLHGTRKR